MKVSRSVLVIAVVMLMACKGGGPSGESVAATAAVAKGPHAHVVTRRFSTEMDKLIVDEHVYVDGVAMRVEDGAGALLTEAPMSACAKLAVVARGNLEFDAATLGEKPALRLVQNSEYPQGAALVGVLRAIPGLALRRLVQAQRRKHTAGSSRAGPTDHATPRLPPTPSKAGLCGPSPCPLERCA